MSFNIFCDPSLGPLSQSLRSDPSGTPVAGNFGAGGNCSAILGGPLTNTNCVCADLSVMLMGQSNTINANIFAGLPNNGLYNTVANGNNNVIGGGYAGGLSI